MAKLFESEFHRGVMVAVVDSLDYQYQVLSPLFSEYGYGFVATDKKLIFIDGTYEDTIQKIVEAHEVGHIKLKHTGTKSPIDEAQADTYAVLLLRQYSYHDAANLLLEEFEKRHGYSFYHPKNKQNKNIVYAKANI
jgi:hypothetical protein